MMNPEPLPVDVFNEEMKTIASSSLYVNVDFNDLVAEHGTQEAFELLGKLKDLLA